MVFVYLQELYWENYGDSMWALVVRAAARDGRGGWGLRSEGETIWVCTGLDLGVLVRESNPSSANLGSSTKLAERGDGTLLRERHLPGAVQARKTSPALRIFTFFSFRTQKRKIL